MTGGEFLLYQTPDGQGRIQLQADRTIRIFPTVAREAARDVERRVERASAEFWHGRRPGTAESHKRGGA